jgi:hypothetical protein
MNASERFKADMESSTPQVLEGPTPQYHHNYLKRATEIARRNPLIHAVDINDDQEMIRRVKHVLKPEETLGEFYARTGLSKSQAALMSEAEILGWSLRSDEQAKDDTNGPQSAWKAKPTSIPKFI